MNFSAHDTYADDGTVIDKGVAFASSHLGTGGSGAQSVASPHGSFGE
jgi:hypothetical protein